MAIICKRCEHDNDAGARFCLQCGAMLELENEAETDRFMGKVLLDRYRIVKVIGEGGMGKVYVAEQKMGTATRNVAIKTLHPELLGDPQLVARFHRECETVIELHHPNIVQFYDFGELDDHTLFIVMEFIKGEDLARRLQRGALDPKLCDKLLIQICGALHEAHQRGIVHRDLKPENILLTSRGGQDDFVKVLDFGIAKRSEAEDESRAKLTKQGMVLGTPPYMSPEQFSGQVLDARSDIYSLSVMAFEMLTGALPFEANTPWEWATKHLTAQPRSLESFPNSAMIPAAKKAAVMRGLSKDRDARQAEVNEFMREFTGIGDAGQAWTLATSSQGVGAFAAAVQQHKQGGYATPPGGPITGPITGPMTGPQGQQGPYYTPNQGHGYPTPSGGYGPIHPTPPPTDYSMLQSVPKRKSFAGLIVGSLVAVLAVVATVMALSQEDPIEDERAVAATQNVEPPQNQGAAQGQGGNVIVEPPDTTMTANTTMTDTANTTMVDTTPDTEDAGTPEETETETASMMATTMASTMTTTMTSTMATTMTSTMTSMASGDPSAYVSQVRSAIGRNDLSAAVTALRSARAISTSDADVRAATLQLTQVGARSVGNILFRGDCNGAVALYRQLNSVGAGGQARSHFNSLDWCSL